MPTNSAEAGAHPGGLPRVSRWRAWSRTTGGKPFLGPGGRPATARYLRQESRLNEENPRLAPCPDVLEVLCQPVRGQDDGSVRAVDDLDLAVCRGDVFGFLGPNGAGKTSTIRMIFGLIYPTQGHVEILGHRVPDERQEALRHVGGFVDDPVFYGNMSAHRNLRLFGGMNGPVSEERIGEVLEMVGLSTRADSKVGGYSHGMRQRLGIALALIHRPDVVVLDEPTSGLDPAGMRDVRGLVRDLATTGTTVFLSSHLLHEVELVANRAAVITRGRLVRQGAVSELRPARSAVRIKTGDQARAWEVLRSFGGAGGLVEEEEYIRVSAPDDQVSEMVRRLVAAGADVEAVIPSFEQGLEEMFLEMTDADEAKGAGAPTEG